MKTFRVECKCPSERRVIYLTLIGNYLRSHLVRASWLAEKQQITSRYQQICPTSTRASVLQNKRPLFLFDTNDVTRNLGCWRGRLRVSMWRTSYEDYHPMRDSTHMRTQNSPSWSLWICTEQPPKLHETKRTITKTNAIVKSAENIFLQLLFFSSLLYLFH